MKCDDAGNRLAAMLLAGSCLLLVPGCGQDSARPARSQQEAEPERLAAGLALELDNGSKWQVDDHTRASAGEMAALIDNTAPIDTVEDARALATAFDEELRNLIQGCTMKGPAHDQLHVFLAALFPRVDALKKETDPAALRKTQQEIGAIFDAYSNHFQ